MGQHTSEAQTHDFWFKNENAQDLPVGVNNKTCQCTSVQLWIAPKDWTEAPAAEDRDRRAKELESVAARTELKDAEQGVTVPAGAVGLVRLGWKGDRAGQHSIRINDQWRICFRWQGADALDVKIVDYH